MKRLNQAMLGMLLLICAAHNAYSQGRSLLETDASAQQRGPGYAVSRPMFVLLGDSITEFGYNGPSGWVTLLSQYYSRKADVINRGMSGWNTRWAREVLPATLQDLIPAVDTERKRIKAAQRSGQTTPWLPRLQLLVIWFGANDAVMPNGKDAFLSVPVSEYKSNLAAMIAAARQAGVKHILLLTPPPVEEEEWAKTTKQKVSDRTNAQVAKYAAAVRALGAETNVPVLDINAIVNGLPADKKAAWSFDGVHPGPEGQALVFESVKTALDSWDAFASLRQSVLPIQWPSYDNVNYKNPRTTFKELFDKQRVIPN